MPVPQGKKLLGASKEFSVNLCRIKSANEFAPTEKSDFTQTGYTQVSCLKVTDNYLLPVTRVSNTNIARASIKKLGGFVVFIIFHC
jgi:hypothetical protein